MKPKVAVILPVWNVMPHLKAMIEAFYNSTDFPFKLIIIDGFSTDGTFEYCTSLLKEKDNIKLYQIPKKGLVNAINFGIKKAGRLDVYLTQADVIHFKLFGKDWLLNMYDNSKRENVGVLTGIAGCGISGPECIDGMRWVGTWNTYLPRNTIDKVGYFDEQFLGMDDIDYSYRIGKANLGGMVTNYWVQHHQLTDRLAGNESQNLKKMAELFRKKWKLGEFK